MAKAFKTNSRVQFPKGLQKKLLLLVLKKSGLSYVQLAHYAGVGPRTFRDWRNEKITMSYTALEKLCSLIQKPIPEDITVLERYWYAQKGASAGGHASFTRQGNTIGDPKRRLKKWREWWEKTGKHQRRDILLPRQVHLPRKSAHLAEFVGMVLGDGTIARYQIVITLSAKVDVAYTDYVVALVTRLFKEPPAVYARPASSVNNITISRRNIIEFCVSLGLVPGNKVYHQVRIPEWIMGDTHYRIACVRGLVDTDGCIFNECHNIKSVRYCYPRLAFVNHSIPLREGVHQILNELGLEAKHRNNRSVHLESKDDIVKYFKLVGTSNPKHRIRYEQFIGRVAPNGKALVLKTSG